MNYQKLYDAMHTGIYLKKKFAIKDMHQRFVWSQKWEKLKRKIQILCNLENQT